MLVPQLIIASLDKIRRRHGKKGDKMKFYNTKKIISKNVVEYTINLDGSTAYDFNAKPRRKRRKFEELEEWEQKESIERRILHYKRKKFHISRLIQCNYNDKSTFLTLTFRENLQDIGTAYNEFNLFMKRLKYYLKVEMLQEELKYIATWELQQRGAIHFHLILFDFPFLEAEKMAELWGNGFIKINKIKDKVKAEEIGNYLVKYFTKDLEQKAMYKKAYSSSKNLELPEEEKKILDLDDINQILITDEEKIIEQKRFIGRQFIGVEDGRRVFVEVEKMYIKKIMDLQNKKNMLELKNNGTEQKELKVLSSSPKNFNK